MLFQCPDGRVRPGLFEVERIKNQGLIITGEGKKAFMAGADIKKCERDFVLGRDQTRRRQQVLNMLPEMPISGYCCH